MTKDEMIQKLLKENAELAQRKSRKVKFSQFVHFKDPHSAGQWAFGTVVEQAPWKSKIDVHYPFKSFVTMDTTLCLSSAAVADLLSSYETQISNLKREAAYYQTLLKEIELREAQEVQAVKEHLMLAVPELTE